ncbi:polyphosphate kinase [Clostridium tepidiprofundi DSM 19306]|uniref:Polyphosphate kinase n=1 Tax=Clostridium tepidiprofundi DSM 19306 TaxID=1121338 RepID=A0A151B2S6_9CLOT|nr:RNA degradosome polyphosphate kinase [Clostridium tepidiprofundi]KYH34090.1 polyphosphate kinase [Clostridium tepidiprofundi DSM 19306]
MNIVDLKNHKNYINRELSWLEFNHRVLEEVQYKSNPLFERLKFMSIVSSNLDEFFMIRVGSLWDQIQAGFHKKDIAGLIPEEQLDLIFKRAYKMMKQLHDTYNFSLSNELKKNGIHFLKKQELSLKQVEFLNNYYRNTVYPVLTPIIVDNSRTFPLILNKSLNIALLLAKDSEPVLGLLQVPSVLGRYIKIPSNNDEHCFMLMEDIIKMYLQEIFLGNNIICSGCFRITRNADLRYDEEEAEDLLKSIEKSLKKRKWGAVVRMEIESNINKKLINRLKKELEIPEKAVYKIDGIIDFTYLSKFYSVNGFDNLKYPKRISRIPIEFENEYEDDVFKIISKKDILLHRPYDSFDIVVKMIQQAAKDNKVLAIKQTLYRVSGNSPLVEALVQAAENGKQVTVLVELKARFDEKNNINWAKRLEKAGCHVIYGLLGLKTHCKILLIVRNEEEGIRRYVHLSTGNYNDVTAKFYTDIDIITSNPYFGEDASALFNMISGYTEFRNMNKFTIAPLDLRDEFIKLIQNEAENAKIGKKAQIIAKFNSLVDKKIIDELYKASASGVKINLIVRGICCLRPGIDGISENINVISIIGRYLEHSRIFYFYNDGEEKLYLSSADWMPRNLDKRVELLFPVEDNEIKDKIKEILYTYLKDNVKARILNQDGTYSRNKINDEKPLNSQDYFYEEINENKKSKEEIEQEEAPFAFRPVRNVEDV